MGCHTWFYKKIDIDYETIKRKVAENFEKDIKFMNKLINKRDSIDADLLTSYPEWTAEYAIRTKSIIERKLSIINKNLCKIAVCNRYSHNDNLTIFIKDKGFFAYTKDLPHDIFRIGNYPKDKLFSLKDTVKFIENHKEDIYFYDNLYGISKTEYMKKINDFWDKNPDGMIDFGQ